MKKSKSVLSIALVLALFLTLALPVHAAGAASVESWDWTKNNGLRKGVLYLAPAHYMHDDIVLRLPKSILVNQGEELMVSWHCPEFPEAGVSWGSWDFDVVLPDGWSQGDDCEPIFARVIIVTPEESADEAEGSSPAVPAPKKDTAPKEPALPKVEEETVVNGDETTTTTTITHPDGTTDVTVTTEKDGEVVRVEEIRTFPDGYYTSDVYTYYPGGNSSIPTTDCAYYVQMLTYEGYRDTKSPDAYAYAFRPKSVGRLEYDENGRLQYQQETIAVQLTDDPAHPDYYNQSSRGDQLPTEINQFFVYETDADGTIVKTTVYADAAHTTALRESWTDGDGKHEKHYVNPYLTQTFDYDTNGRLLKNVSTAVNDDASVSTNVTTYTHDKSGRILSSTTEMADGSLVTSTRTYGETGDYTEQIYRQSSPGDSQKELLETRNVNGASGRVVSSTTYNPDSTSKTVEFVMGDEGTYKQVTNHNADSSYSITRYDKTAGKNVITHYSADGTVLSTEPTDQIMLMSLRPAPSGEADSTDGGNPDETADPKNSSSPEDTGSPDDPGSPEDTDSPENTGSPDDSNSPENPGSPGDTGNLENPDETP